MEKKSRVSWYAAGVLSVSSRMSSLFVDNASSYTGRFRKNPLNEE